MPKWAQAVITIIRTYLRYLLCICISQVVKFYVSIFWSSEAKEKVKMASGGMVLIKYLLFFFNFIFWVSIFLVT